MPPKSSFGTLLKRGNGDGPPETFTAVGGQGDLDGPDEDQDFEETTTQNSALNGNYKEWLPTLQDGGEVKTQVFWDPNDLTHQGIQSDRANRVLRNWQTVFPTSPNKTASFSGYVKSFKFKAPVKGVLTRELVVKITGPVTIS